MRRNLLPVLIALMLGACSDAATRVAYDIESGVKKLGRGDGARAEISHVPRSWPEGCSGTYTLRLARGFAIDEGRGDFRIAPDSGGLNVNCFSSDGNARGWGTTYHLRFVDVPVPLSITKERGEPSVIEVERRAGRAVVTGLR